MEVHVPLYSSVPTCLMCIWFWRSLYLPLIFNLTLDMPKKFEWYIYQLFLSLLLWVLGHGSQSPRAPRAGPGPGPGGARPRPADTNVTLFKGFSDLLHFENYFFCHFNNCFCESGWFYDNHQLDWGQKGAGMGGSYRLISPYPTDLYKLPVEFSYIEETTKFADAPADEWSMY